MRIIFTFHTKPITQQHLRKTRGSEKISSPWIYFRCAYIQNIYTHKSYHLSCLYLPITINSFPFLNARRGTQEIAFFVVQTILLFGTQRWRQRWCLNDRRKHAKVSEQQIRRIRKILQEQLIEGKALFVEACLLVVFKL